MKQTDHFSSLASAYAQFRPGYPEELYAYILEGLPSRNLLWDCASGNGLVASALSPEFEKVIATDISESQLMQGPKLPNVFYKIGSAEKSGLDDHSADLITVATAYHWFDFEAFAKEAKRVGKKGGILAVWTYGPAVIESPFEPLMHEISQGILGDYWPKERIWVDVLYQDIPFEFANFERKEFSMCQNWNSQQILGYTSSWSAVKEFRRREGKDPLPLMAQLANQIGETTVKITWPLVVLKASL